MVMGLNITKHRLRTVNFQVCVPCLLLMMSPECYNTKQETVSYAYSDEDASRLPSEGIQISGSASMPSHLSSLCDASNSLSKLIHIHGSKEQVALAGSRFSLLS